MKYQKKKISSRHEQISLNEDGSFDIFFIIKGTQYQTRAYLPDNIDPLDIKWYCQSIARDHRNNKLRKLLRKEIW